MRPPKKTRPGSLVHRCTLEPAGFPWTGSWKTHWINHWEREKMPDAERLTLFASYSLQLCCNISCLGSRTFIPGKYRKWNTNKLLSLQGSQFVSLFSSLHAFMLMVTKVRCGPTSTLKSLCICDDCEQTWSEKNGIPSLAVNWNRRQTFGGHVSAQKFSFWQFS